MVCASVRRCDPKRGFTDFGDPEAVMNANGIAQGISWRAVQIEAVAACEDGRCIVLGADESLRQLMISPLAGAARIRGSQ